MRCDTSFGAAPRRAGCSSPRAAGPSSSPPWAGAKRPAAKRGCYSTGGQNPWKCRRAAEMGSSVSLMAALQCCSRALMFSEMPFSGFWAMQKCGRGGKPEHTRGVGRCWCQPWGPHGLSLHGSDTSAACWGSAQARDGEFFRHIDCRVLSRGRFNRRGLV